MELEKHAEAFESRGVEVVAISVDPVADSQALRERLGLSFPLLHDENLAAAEAYGVAMKGEDIAVPSTFVVMPDRSIAWSYVGEAAPDRPAEKELLEQLDRAIAKHSPEPGP